MTGSHIWPGNNRSLAMDPTLGRSTWHMDSVQGGLSQTQLCGLDASHMTPPGDITKHGLKGAGQQNRTAQGLSKVGVGGKQNTPQKTHMDTLFSEKLSLQAPKKAQSEMIEIFEQPLYFFNLTDAWFKIIPFPDHIIFSPNFSIKDTAFSAKGPTLFEKMLLAIVAQICTFKYLGHRFHQHL